MSMQQKINALSIIWGLLLKLHAFPDSPDFRMLSVFAIFLIVISLKVKKKQYIFLKLDFNLF